MNDHDRPRFVVALSALASTFNREPSDAMLAGYWIGMAGLPVEAVEHACQRALRSCRFMPVPAELREMAGEMKPEDRAVKAWEAYSDAVATVGYYQSVDFDDKLINATVRNLGGWMELIVRMDDEDHTDKWVRKDFERVYTSLMRSGVSPEGSRYLLGCHERNNVAKGLGDRVELPVVITTGLPPLAEPVRIGREQQLLERAMPGKEGA